MASWRINSRLAHSGARAILALVVLSSLCQADPTMTQPVAVAPNQSVSLAEGAVAAEPHDRQGAPDSGAARQPVVGADTRSNRQETTGRTLLLRQRDPEVTRGRTQVESMPWYRTGVGALGVVLALVGGPALVPGLFLYSVSEEASGVGRSTAFPRVG